eukprot:4048092-Amphidinium_carterae.1
MASDAGATNVTLNVKYHLENVYAPSMRSSDVQFHHIQCHRRLGPGRYASEAHVRSTSCLSAVMHGNIHEPVRVRVLAFLRK